MRLDDDPSDRFREGTIIAEKYALTHVLGRGGMGLVVAATHLQLERRVAIKFLLPEHLAKPDVVGRFTREARSAAKIQSDHVAHVLDVGIDDGTPYMVMEYLEGEDLKEVLSERGPLSIEETVRYVRQACDALAHAHALGIVHRDLKPANLFLAKRPNGRKIVKLLDFGISKIMNPATETELTLTSRAVGSPSYMSPEQLTGSRSLDARADIWALGVVMYELLTRRRPFSGESMPSLVAQILRGKFEKLDAVRPDLPAGLVAAVHRCLELEPDNRFGTVGELTEAFGAYASTESFSSLDDAVRAARSSFAPPAPGQSTSGSMTPASLARASAAASSLVPPPEEDSNAGHVQTGIASVVTPTSRRPGRGRTGVLVACGGLGMIVALGLGSLLVRRVASHAANPASPANSAGATALEPRAQNVPAFPAPPAVAPEASPASLPPTLAPPATGSATAEGSEARRAPSVEASPSATPAAPAPRRGTRAPVASARPKVASPAPSALASTAAAPPCHLVSYFDALGDKHFRQECP